MSASTSKPRRRGNRRVTAPGTSGQPEDQESQAHDPLRDSDEPQREQSEDPRSEWLKGERPPHW